MCESIAKKLAEEKALEEAEQLRLNRRRLKLLDTLHKRHEENCELELKAGIAKPLYNDSVRPQTASSCLKLGYANPDAKKYKDSQTVARLKTPRPVMSMQNNRNTSRRMCLCTRTSAD
eukprot:TRINITY_DN4048_c0_g1_i4.p1 TRINITY_DN4048_c0_g1~~TRINITY_DN4048_c0_g1_i4.p1  ORF type:complete len:118 (+),score=21.21 TRINITY_DN4048_c0_g1_i4:709-1062(+)